MFSPFFGFNEEQLLLYILSSLLFSRSIKSLGCLVTGGGAAARASSLVSGAAAPYQLGKTGTRAAARVHEGLVALRREAYVSRGNGGGAAARVYHRALALRCQCISKDYFAPEY